jgi:hypothetical protein
MHQDQNSAEDLTGYRRSNLQRYRFRITGRYAEGTSYTAFGQPEQVTLGSGTSEAFVTDTYDPRTGNLTDQAVTRSTTTPTTVDSTSYGYSPAGALTSETDERLGSTTTTAAGCAISEAVSMIRDMAGHFRLPDALRKVDRLARGIELPVSR